MEILNSLLCYGPIVLITALSGISNVVTKRTRIRAGLGRYKHYDKFIEGKDAIIIGWAKIVIAVLLVIFGLFISQSN